MTNRDVRRTDPGHARSDLRPEYGSSWALVVGINAYHHLRPLRYAVNDARSVRELLTAELGFPQENVFLLLDEEATKDALEEILIDRLPRVTQPDDRVLIFLAGHGMSRPLPSGQREGYYAPVDARSDMWRSHLSMRNLRHAGDQTAAKHVFYIIDACFSGLATGRAAVRPSRYQVDKLINRARQVLTAGLDDQVVDDSGPHGHSIFTWHLLQGLRGEARQPGDNVVTASNLMLYVMDRVGRDPDSGQTPDYGQLAGHEAGGDFLFRLAPREADEARARLPFEPETVLIPEGEFIMGSEDGLDDEKPPHRIYLAAYQIGRYAVTNREYHTFVQDEAHPPRSPWVGGSYPEGMADHPVVNINWHEAGAYCRWLSEKTGRSYRLPTEAEWEKAASWDPKTEQQRQYPWGDEFDPARCNSGGGGGTTPVGRYSPAGDSAYGVADMAGNVWEWCSSLCKPYPYDSQDGREDQEAPGQRVLRGGALDIPWLARCAARSGTLPDSPWIEFGFRVVASG